MVDSRWIQSQEADRRFYDGLYKIDAFIKEFRLETWKGLEELKEIGLPGKSKGVPIPVAPVWVPLTPPTFQDLPRNVDLEFDLLPASVLDEGTELAWVEEIAAPIENKNEQLNSNPKVISNPLELVVKVELDRKDEITEFWPAKGGITDVLIDNRTNLIGFWGITSAHQVFVEMPMHNGIQLGMIVFNTGAKSSKFIAATTDEPMFDEGNQVFDPGGVVDSQNWRSVIGLVLVVQLGWQAIQVQLRRAMPFLLDLERMCVVEFRQIISKSFPYDRGKSGNAIAACFSRFELKSYVEVATIKGFVFDPGGIDPLLREKVAHQFSEGTHVGSNCKFLSSCLPIMDAAQFFVTASGYMSLEA